MGQQGIGQHKGGVVGVEGTISGTVEEVTDKRKADDVGGGDDGGGDVR